MPNPAVPSAQAGFDATVYLTHTDTVIGALEIATVSTTVDDPTTGDLVKVDGLLPYYAGFRGGASVAARRHSSTCYLRNTALN